MRTLPGSPLVRRSVGLRPARCLLALLLAACGDVAGPDGPGPLATLTPESGIPTKGVVGESLDVAPAVTAKDVRGRPLAGVEVRFEVRSGGGSVQDAAVVTGADGVARVGEWRLGATLGEQRLVATASAEGGESPQVEFRVTAGWRWTALPAPLGDPEVSGFHIHPTDDRTWYALSIREGISVTTDAGETWTRTLWEEGVNKNGFEVDPTHPDTIFAAFRNRLVVSGDRGASWSERYVFDVALWIRSLTVLQDGTLLVGPQWPAGQAPGVFRSEDRGVTWTHHPYGVQEGRRILTWVLRQDPATGIVWSGNEIADHPQPYHPPFLSSSDGGRTWADVSHRLPFDPRQWHVIQVMTAGDRLYALSEGAGLFVSQNGGATWQSLGRPFASALMVHPGLSHMVFGGDFGHPYGQGAVMVSPDGGASFVEIERIFTNVSALALTGDRRRLVVSSWGAGLRMAHLPEWTP
jgi:photosystem II stability/assembly factor-like uncharacterized protein